jgi:hypothetical protein
MVVIPAQPMGQKAMQMEEDSQQAPKAAVKTVQEGKAQSVITNILKFISLTLRRHMEKIPCDQ